MVTYVSSRKFHERLWAVSEPGYNRISLAAFCNLQVGLLGVNLGDIVNVPNSCQLPKSGNVCFTS